MGAPPQGMGGPTDEDHRREERQHKEIVRLGLISIMVALVIGLPVVYLGIQTSLALDEIKSINKRLVEIENAGPYVKSKGLDIVLPVNPNPDDNKYGFELSITPISKNPVRVSVENVTLVSGTGLGCFFVEEPKVSLAGTWREILGADETDSPIFSVLSIDYQTQPELTELDLTGTLSPVTVGWLWYTITVHDMNTQNKVIVESIGNLVTYLPIEYLENNWHCSR